MKIITLYISIIISVMLITPIFGQQWEPERRLTFDNANSQLSDNNARCLACDSNYVHIVWQDMRSGDWEIFYKHSTDYGLNWSGDHQLTNNTASSTTPSIAVMDSCIYVVWADDRTSIPSIFLKYSTDYGITWTPDTCLSDNINSYNRPCISANDSLLHLVYGSATGLFYQRSFNHGISWTSETCLVNTTSVTHACIYTVRQKVHIIFREWVSWIDSIFYFNSLDAGSSWNSLVGLDGYEYLPGLHRKNVYAPALIAIDPNVYTVWRTYTLAEHGPQYHYDQVKGKKSTDNGITWSWMPIPTKSTMDSVHSPTIAACDSNIYVLYRQPDLYSGWGKQILYTESSDYGANWTYPIILNADTTWVERPFIDACAECIHVIWVDGRDGNNEIYYKRTQFTGSYEFKSNTVYFDKNWRVRWNPFRTYTCIYNSPETRIIIYNATGRLVGKYSSNYIGYNLPPGIYFLQPDINKRILLKLVKIE